MSPTVTRSGILVGVDGSAESDAAIRWATHEAVMRRAANDFDACRPTCGRELADGAGVRRRSPNGNVTTRGMFSSKRSRRYRPLSPSHCSPMYTPRR